MSVWFSSAAVLGEMTRAAADAGAPLERFAASLLSSAVQVGFAIGAVVYAVLGLADRYDPRKVFAASALLAALANAVLVVAPIGGALAVASRFATGAFLAGVYPVGMKIAVGWGARDRGLLVGLVVGALTLGSAAPHLLALTAGLDAIGWRGAVLMSSGLATLGAGLVLRAGLGPGHASARAFRWRSLGLAWTDPRLRLAYAGYLGHMWELYAMWAWIGAALVASFGARMDPAAAAGLSKLTAFAAVGAGALACVAAGLLADRIGKAETTILAMAGSGGAAVLAALAFYGPPLALIAIVLVWGAFVIADSAQFSALVADAAPPDAAGALLTLQTALGFALTALTVQAAPAVAVAIGWPGLFMILALGPAAGCLAMARLRGVLKEGRA